MIVYNVTVNVDPEVHGEWLQWMKAEHIPRVMNTGMFVEHRICRLLEQDESEGVTYAIQYLCKSMDIYETYRHEFATNLQQEHLERFRDKFVAFRTLMEVVG
jgi:hypothetical protein